MRIPRSFRLLGYTFEVVIVPKLHWQDDASSGGYQAVDKKLFVCEGPPDLMEHTFWHELTHAILDLMNRDKLCADEAFVDVFSGLLHQAVATADKDLIEAPPSLNSM